MRLAICIRMRRAHKLTQHMHLIRRNTLTNGRMVGRVQLTQSNRKLMVVYTYMRYLYNSQGYIIGERLSVPFMNVTVGS